VQVCTSLRQITIPAPHHSVFYRPDALPAAQKTASKHWRHCGILRVEKMSGGHQRNVNTTQSAQSDCLTRPLRTHLFACGIEHPAHREFWTIMGHINLHAHSPNGISQLPSMTSHIRSQQPQCVLRLVRMAVFWNCWNTRNLNAYLKRYLQHVFLKCILYFNYISYTAICVWNTKWAKQVFAHSFRHYHLFCKKKQTLLCELRDTVAVKSQCTLWDKVMRTELTDILWFNLF